MKYIKNLWPLVLIAVAICVCINEWNTNASTDAGGVIVFAIVTFFFILPVCTLISGIWYGYILEGRVKWLILAASIIPGVIIGVICADTFTWEGLIFEVPPVIAAVIGLLIGNAIRKHRKK